MGGMDVVAIQNELETLSPGQQDKISDFLTALRMKRQGLMKEISRRLDDDNPQNWVAWDDAKVDFEHDPPG